MPSVAKGVLISLDEAYWQQSALEQPILKLIHDANKELALASH
jgi:hypothetical protein